MTKALAGDLHAFRAKQGARRKVRDARADGNAGLRNE